MKKRALLIGINNYQYKNEIGGLQGCVNDTELMASVLQRKFGFGKDDITFLWNEKATKDGIVIQLRRILEDCESNDTIVFYFSGHGTRRKAREANKPDNFDETILPHDTRAEPYLSRDIHDSELRNWMALLTEKTSNIHIFFDCCHSGSMVRDGKECVNVRNVRGIVTDELREISTTPVKIPVQPDSSLFSAPAVDWSSLSDFYSMLTACGKDERAKEFPVPVNGNSKYHGAFTYFLVQELEKAPAKFTYQDIFEQLCIAMKAKSSLSQSAQIEGNSARQPFSSVEINTMKYVPVENRAQDKIILSAGMIQGLTVNSEWAVYEPGAKYPSPEEKLGNVKIVDVDVISSTAKIMKGNKTHKISAGCRAVEEIHYYKDQKKSVYIDSPLTGLREIEKIVATDVKASSWLRLTNTKVGANFIVALSMPGSAGKIAGKVRAEILQVNGEDDAQVLLEMPNLNRDGFGKIRQNLEKLSKYFMILNLENSSSNLKELVEFTLLQKVKGKWQKAEPVYRNLPKYVEGEQIAFQVVNKSSIPIYVSVLDLGLTKRISLLYPQKDASEKIAQGAGQKNPDRGILRKGLIPIANDTMTLSIPTDTFLSKLPGINKKGGVEVFKLMITTGQTNFSFIQQAGLKSRGTPKSALEDLFYKYLAEMRTRDAEFDIAKQDDWFTINRAFYLCKK
jgi:hypothetical protein